MRLRSALDTPRRCDTLRAARPLSLVPFSLTDVVNSQTRQLLTEPECQRILQERLDQWTLESGPAGVFVQRIFATSSWSMTVHAANAVAFLAELGWHHPVLLLDYRTLTVRLRSNDVQGITLRDIELALRIDETLTWLPNPDDALPGHRKRYVH